MHPEVLLNELSMPHIYYWVGSPGIPQWVYNHIIIANLLAGNI